MEAKQGRGGRKSSETFRFVYFICMCVPRLEQELLWLAPGSSVCQSLFPADKRWPPSFPPPALPVVLLHCQQHRTVVSLGSPVV